MASSAAFITTSRGFPKALRKSWERSLRQSRGSLASRVRTAPPSALFGFANLSSIGIQIGGIGALAPNKRGELARLGVRAMLAGTMANLMSASIAGMLL